MINDQSTLMSVPLDQLRAFDLNPRITRNPSYDDIKESIRNRGLDHPPQITQRPGEKYYIIASGGNTRLAILNDLWLETHDKKYWNVSCLFHPWTSESLAQGNLNCLLGHLVENEMRGSLTFIERALAMQNVIRICNETNVEHSQRDLVKILSENGYFISQTQLSVMSSAIELLLPYIPDLLYCGLSRRNTERLLILRSNTERFWDKHCKTLPPETEQQLPLFDDIFSMALISFNEPAADFSLSLIQDELTGLVSQTLKVDYNTVALVTDARAQKRSVLLGADPIPELPEISEQRSVEPKYRDKPGAGRAYQPENEESDEPGDEHIPEETEQQYSVVNTTVAPAMAEISCLNSDPLFSTPESLSSLIDQIAWELAGHAGLEHLISSTETGIFDIASPSCELSNEGKIYWQLLSFLAGKLPGSAVIWRQMLTGSSARPAGFNEATLNQVFQLIRCIRRLYENQCQGEKA
ncbi:TPA: ParB family protein [Salmonella enterica subsp. diarizonae serovar 61:l,v:z35]|nr:hypothetical protein [Salmonella enterica subsp. enterica serovar Newport]